MRFPPLSCSAFLGKMGRGKILWLALKDGKAVDVSRKIRIKFPKVRYSAGR